MTSTADTLETLFPTPEALARKLESLRDIVAANFPKRHTYPSGSSKLTPWNAISGCASLSGNQRFNQKSCAQNRH